jgi:hypothetical protein
MVADWGVLELRLNSPIVQTDDFSYLAAFVSVFLCFRGTLLGLAEGVFCVADGFVDQVQRFSHTVFFLAAGLFSSTNPAAFNLAKRAVPEFFPAPHHCVSLNRHQDKSS